MLRTRRGCSPRRRTARSLRWTVDMLLLAVSVGASTSTAPPSMPHPGRPTSTLRRRTRTRHRSPPRTGCALFRLTSSPTRTGPARGGAAARGRGCGGSVRTRRTVPDHFMAAGKLTHAELPARDLGHGRLLLAACPSPHAATTPGRFSFAGRVARRGQPGNADYRPQVPKRRVVHDQVLNAVLAAKYGRPTGQRGCPDRADPCHSAGRARHRRGHRAGVIRRPRPADRGCRRWRPGRHR